MKTGSSEWQLLDIATTISSSEINKAIREKTLPKLAELHASLKSEIQRRQFLLEEAAELQMNLNHLKEYEEGGYLTNQGVIGLVETALFKINSELNKPNNDTTPSNTLSKEIRGEHSPHIIARTIEDSSEKKAFQQKENFV